MKEKELRDRIKKLLIKEARAYQAYYDLANSLADASGGALHANQSQGKIKGRDPHARLMLTDIGKDSLAGILDKINAKKGGWSNSTLKAEWGNAVSELIGNVPNAKYIGPSTAILSKTFPALDFKYDPPLSPGQDRKASEYFDPEQPQIIHVVVTVPGARVAKGAAYQDATASHIVTALETRGYRVNKVNTAAKGSQVADVEIKISYGDAGEENPLTAEVKGPGGKFFDKTMQRGVKSNTPEKKLIDAMAAAMSNAKGLPSSTLEEYVDKIQAKQKQGKNRVTVGYIGDPDLSKSKITKKDLASGALASDYFSVPPTDDMIAGLIAHWAVDGDNYFVVTDGSISYVWFTGHGVNVLKASKFGIGSISGDIKLSTYGSAGPGRLRVALSAKFNTGDATPLGQAPLLASARSKHPGLLDSLAGLMVEAYAPGTKIGLIPMAAKPYHAGHHSLVETAAAENDQVLLYISLSDRKRKGELTIQGSDMERIWKEEIEKILPGNVIPVYGGIPVRKVYEILGDAEEKLQMDVEPPVYTVYSDPTDTARNYSAAYRMKYFPTVASEGYVKFAGEESPESFTRGEGTPDVSGTKMRASLQCGDEAAFAEGLPPGVDKEKIFNMLCPMRQMEESVERAQFKQAVKRVHRNILLKEQSMYDTFVKPFTDVVAVTKLVAQDVLAASVLNLKLWWSLDPKKHREAFAKYDQTKKAIDAKMKPYMDAVDERLANSDTSIIAATIAPGFFFGQMALEGAYEAATTTTDFLRGAGLEIPLVGALFPGEEVPEKAPPPKGEKGILGSLKALFFGESISNSLPILVEQAEEKQQKKLPFDEAIKDWLLKSGVTEKFDSYADELHQSTEKYIDDVLAMVLPIAEISLALRATDKESIGDIKNIMAKAKEYNLPGADQFEQKIQAAAKNIADNPEFEKTADELADKKDNKSDGASDKEEQAAAEMTTVAEFIDSFIKDSEDGLPKLIAAAKEKLDEEKPTGINLEALNTSDKGKKYVELFTNAYDKLDKLGQTD